MFAALVLAAGNLVDRLGRKGVPLTGLAVFGVATVAGGLGTSPGQLIAARAVMGLGAALIFPATLSLLTNVFTERGERAGAIGLWGATTGVGIAVGPIVGGWLLEHFSWSSVFFALAPIAVLAAVLVTVYVPASRDPAAPPADRAGLVLVDGGDGAGRGHEVGGAQRHQAGGRRRARIARRRAHLGLIGVHQHELPDHRRPDVLLGSGLGVAVIGSVYASLYSSRLDLALPGPLPSPAATVAHQSVGGAFQTAAQLRAEHHTALAQGLHDAATTAFFHGFSVACLLAAGVTMAGAVMAAALIPAQPPRSGAPAATAPVPASSLLVTSSRRSVSTR